VPEGLRLPVGASVVATGRTYRLADPDLRVIEGDVTVHAPTSICVTTKLMRSAGTYLYGRRMYELKSVDQVMAVY